MPRFRAHFRTTARAAHWRGGDGAPVGPNGAPTYRTRRARHRPAPAHHIADGPRKHDGRRDHPSRSGGHPERTVDPGPRPVPRRAVPMAASTDAARTTTSAKSEGPHHISLHTPSRTPERAHAARLRVLGEHDGDDASPSVPARECAPPRDGIALYRAEAGVRGRVLDSPPDPPRRVPVRAFPPSLEAAGVTAPEAEARPAGRWKGTPPRPGPGRAVPPYAASWRGPVRPSRPLSGQPAAGNHHHGSAEALPAVHGGGRMGAGCIRGARAVPRRAEHGIRCSPTARRRPRPSQPRTNAAKEACSMPWCSSGAPRTAEVGCPQRQDAGAAAGSRPAPPRCRGRHRPVGRPARRPSRPRTARSPPDTTNGPPSVAEPSKARPACARSRLREPATQDALFGRLCHAADTGLDRLKALLTRGRENRRPSCRPSVSRTSGTRRCSTTGARVAALTARHQSQDWWTQVRPRPSPCR
ncbi:hypothetical protein CLV72_109153 [Allonocardiopsis opalescens]|uniref:Uncharacterized protein n=1 Tax=Allonocardiopsis opalescens TaxID=1144618 RepID=A0A2T0PVI5_9ACTN|nr:hypothetical protein CLV72_109153 [Allonocardiopsis opalescens]